MLKSYIRFLIAIIIAGSSIEVSLKATIKLNLMQLNQMLAYLYNDNKEYHRMIYDIIEDGKDVPPELKEYLAYHPCLKMLATILEKKVYIKPRLKTLLLYYFVIDFYLDEWLEAIFKGDFATGYMLYESVHDESPLPDDVKEMLAFNDEDIPLIRLFTSDGLLKDAYVEPFIECSKKHLQDALQKNLTQITKDDFELTWQLYDHISDDKVLPITALHVLKQEPEGNALLSLINNQGHIVPTIKEQVVTILSKLVHEKLGTAYAQREERKRKNFAQLMNAPEPAAGSPSP